MKRKTIGKGIFCIENFLPEHDLAALQNFCNDTNGDWSSTAGWDNESLWENNTRHVAGDDAATMALYKVNIAMGELVNSSVSIHRPNYSINKFTKKSNPKKEGSTFWDDDEWSMNPHYDSGYGAKGHQSVNSADDGIDVMYGALFYINDDYEGGEVVYTQQGITFKPKANTILIHNSLFECEHGVKKVKSGERFTLSTFAFKPGSIYA
jgi:hypothetical protein